MSDETINLSAKTWTRTVDSINKEGYSDGVVDGQAASFQSSFDVGYIQGFEFGFNLGITKANFRDRQSRSEDENDLIDTRKINCQICLDNNTINDNIVNLYNKQLEKNNEYLLKYGTKLAQ